MTALVVSVLAQIWPYLLVAGGAIIGLLGYGRSKRLEGVSQQKAKEAEQRARNLDELRKAADAAAAVRPGASELSDPNNRDNWK